MAVFTSKLEFSTRFVSRLTPSHVARLVGVAVGVELVLVEEMEVPLDGVMGEAVDEEGETLEDVSTEELAMLPETADAEGEVEVGGDGTAVTTWRLGLR